MRIRDWEPLLRSTYENCVAEFYFQTHDSVMKRTRNKRKKTKTFSASFIGTKRKKKRKRYLTNPYILVWLIKLALNEKIRIFFAHSLWAKWRLDHSRNGTINTNTFIERGSAACVHACVGNAYFRKCFGAKSTKSKSIRLRVITSGSDYVYTHRCAQLLWETLCLLINARLLRYFKYRRRLKSVFNTFRFSFACSPSASSIHEVITIMRCYVCNVHAAAQKRLIRKCFNEGFAMTTAITWCHQVSSAFAICTLLIASLCRVFVMRQSGIPDWANSIWMYAILCRLLNELTN